MSIRTPTLGNKRTRVQSDGGIICTAGEQQRCVWKSAQRSSTVVQQYSSMQQVLPCITASTEKNTAVHRLHAPNRIDPKYCACSLYTAILLFRLPSCNVRNTRQPDRRPFLISSTGMYTFDHFHPLFSRFPYSFVHTAVFTLAIPVTPLFLLSCHFLLQVMIPPKDTSKEALIDNPRSS